MRTHHNLLHTAVLVLGAGLAVACSGGTAKPVEEARRDFETGRFVTAWERLQAAVPSDSDDATALAARGHAAQAVNRYDEAVPYLRRAVELAPDEPLHWEWYLGALAWGGLMTGERGLLEEALEQGGQGLRTGWDRPGLYDHLLTAAESLQALTRYRGLVERIRMERPGEPVPEIENWEFLLQTAAASGDSARLAQARAELSVQTVSWRLQAGAGAVPTDGELYRLALAYLMTGRRAEARPLLEELERRPTARRFSRPLRYDYLVLPDYVSLYRAGDLPGIRDRIADWLTLLGSEWESTVDYRRVLLDWQVDAIIRSTTGEGIPQEDLETLLGAAEELFRRDTWGGVEQYERIAGLLAERDLLPDRALEIIGEGLARLASEEPGMLMPGQEEEEARRARDAFRATLLDLRVRILERSGRETEAAVDRETIERISARLSGPPETVGTDPGPAPDFHLRDTSGREWRLSDLRGRPVVLAFWSPWNGESLRLVQDLDRFARSRRQGEVADDTVYLAVSVGPGERPDGLLPGLGLPRVDAPGDLALRYRVTGIPTTLLIDGQGRIRWRQSGYPGREALAERLARRLEIVRR